MLYFKSIDNEIYILTDTGSLYVAFEIYNN